jgi:hypothetical protein
LESKTWEISGEMNDVLTRAACDFEDDTRHRQDIAKDIENEIAIAQVAGAYWRSSPILPAARRELRP